MQENLFVAHHALEERHWWFRARRRAIRELAEVLLPPHGRVVDVGCGTGADIASFADSYHRHGIDQSATAIAFAQERHAGVQFDVASLPGTGPGVDALHEADVVLLCDVLEHIEDDTGFLGWLVSAMKPGSHLLLTVPADMRLWSPHDEIYGHFRRYTRHTLEAVWSDAPVAVKLLAPFNRVLYPVARVARAVASRRGRAWGSERGDLALPWAPVNRLLETLFASEIPVLRAALTAERAAPGGNSVSLIAVLRKEAAQ